MSLAIYSLGLSLVEALIWLHLWLTMCFLIVQNVDPLFTCSLDAEGAFDAVLHSVLFKKALSVIPDHCWRVMVHWNRSITVRIKRDGKLSDSIKVCKGTHQGGLSSPFPLQLILSRFDK